MDKKQKTNLNNNKFFECVRWNSCRAIFHHSLSSNRSIFFINVGETLFSVDSGEKFEFHFNMEKSNVNSDFSIITMRRVKIIFFALGVVESSMQKF